MPMIDVYATAGTFPEPHRLAADLARTLMVIEGVPDIPMFRQNTAAFIHDLADGALSNVDGESSYVRGQVLTPIGEKQLGVVKELTEIVAAAGGDYTPAAFWNRGQEFEGSGHGGHVGRGCLASFDLPGLGFGVEMRGEPTNNLDGADTMRGLQNLRGVEPVFVRPDGVLLGNDAGGVEENTVEIEEDGGAPERGHRLSEITLRVELS